MEEIILEMEEALQYGADRLGHSVLYKEQKAAITSALQGKDVFITLPTGYGKSLVYQALPFCAARLRAKTSTSHPSYNTIIIIVSSYLSDVLLLSCCTEYSDTNPSSLLFFSHTCVCLRYTKKLAQLAKRIRECCRIS